MYAIAIDGPAGAGKSSVAKAAAKALGFVYVDTGALCDAVQGQVGVGLGEAQLVMAKCKNWDLDSKVVVTNKCPAGIVRGYGGQELNSCLARVMSHCMMLADKDPIEIFKKIT